LTRVEANFSKKAFNSSVLIEGDEVGLLVEEGGCAPYVGCERRMDGVLP
jgi:hypothetical protein